MDQVPSRGTPTRILSKVVWGYRRTQSAFDCWRIGNIVLALSVFFHEANFATVRSTRSYRKVAMSHPAKVATSVDEKNLQVELRHRAPVDVRLYGRRVPGASCPLVLHFHGGAFVSGDLDSGCTVARMLAGAGAVVVSLAYPLAPEHPFPDGVDTGYGVLEWLYKHRVKLAGQGARIFLAGEEAGGNMAAAVAVISRDRGHPPLAGQILLSPMLDPCLGTASQRDAMKGSTTCKWEQGWKQYLPCSMHVQHPYAVPGASHRLIDLPPTLIACGADDPLRDEARAYAERLRSAGIVVTYEVISNASNWPDALTQASGQACPCEESVKQLFRHFFEATWGPPEADKQGDS
jgi:acetyl esterase